MKLGIVTDILCDIPKVFLNGNNLHILPSKVIVDGKVLQETISPATTQTIYKHIHSKKNIITDSSSTEDITSILTDILSTNDYDYLIILTTMSSKSNFYLNCTEAAVNAKTLSNQVRQEKGYSLNPIIEVVDSKQTSTGLGILISDLIKSHNEYLNFEDLLEHLNNRIKYTNTIFVPNDLKKVFFDTKNGKEHEIVSLKSYIGHALNIKPIILFNNGQINLIDTKVGIKKSINKALSDTMAKIYDNKLSEPFIHLAYSGPMEELKANKNYLRFLEVAKEKNIKIFKSNISGTLAAHIGIRSLLLSYIIKE